MKHPKSQPKLEMGVLVQPEYNMSYISEQLNIAASSSTAYHILKEEVRGTELEESTLYIRDALFIAIPNALKDKTPTNSISLAKVALYETCLVSVQSHGLTRIDLAPFVRQTIDFSIPQLITAICNLQQLIQLTQTN